MAKAKENPVIKLKKQIQSGEFAKLYLFFGEETYLRDYYIGKVFDAVPDNGFAEFNHIRIDGREASLSEIDDALESFPMMAEKRIVMISDSGVFKKANEEQKEFYLSRLARLADDTLLIFCENEVDKRSALYKAAGKYGEVIEFEQLGEAEAVTWLMREANEMGCSISKDTAQYFVGIAEPSLGALKNELEKCAGYCSGEITRSDVDRLVSKSLQMRVFDLCDCMMERNADKALALLAGLKTVRESPFAILYVLFSTFDKMLHAKLMEANGERTGEIASKLKLPPFVAGKYLKGAKKFSVDELSRLIIQVSETDLAIKQGKTDDWAALEDYIYGYFAK